MPKFEVLVRQCAPWMFVVILTLIIGPRCLAQASSALLTVGLTDASGALIPNARVAIRNVDTNQEQHDVSGKTGSVTFTYVKPGHYTLRVTKDTFAEVAVDNIVLNVGDAREFRLTLRVSSTSQTVTVDGSGSTINTTDASVSTVIDRKFVEAIPLNGRSFQSLMTLSPGVAVVPSPTFAGANGAGYSGEITVNGQRTEANYFTVDGVSATLGASGTANGSGAGFSGSVAGETALGTTQSLVSIDALQEFRATTSTFSAEYGRTPGGQFSFVTRSGTKELHGTAFDYFRNEALDAGNWFNGYTNTPPLRRPAERQNDFGGTLGGPVKLPWLYNGKDKTFFFFSYEGLRLQTPQTATQLSVPDASLRGASPSTVQSVLNAFPIANRGEDGLNDGLGLFSASYSNSSSLDSTSIRIDHTFTDKFSVFGRFSDTPSQASTRYSADLAIIQPQQLGGKGITLGATNAFSERLSNEFRFNYSSDSGEFHSSVDTFGGAQPYSSSSIGLPDYSVFGVELFFGGFPGISLSHEKNSQNQFNVTDSVSVTYPRHHLKFGVDYRRLATQIHQAPIAETFYFYSPMELTSNNATEGDIYSSALLNEEPIYTNFSAFGQDEWKASPRLALSLGVRWDVNPAPADGYGNPPYTVTQITNLATTQLAPKGTPLWRTTYGDFAPRLGAAYQVHQGIGHETVLRAGFGNFYDTGNTLGSEGYQGEGFNTFTAYSGVAFPFTEQQLNVPPPSVAPPYSSQIYAFDPHLKLPYTLQWNAALEQALGANQTLSFTYVGSAGRDLLFHQEFLPSALANPNFTTALWITANKSTSIYHSLQVKFQRTLARGFQTLGSYTWSHSIDNASTTFNSNQLLRSVSDFDIRNNFQVAMIYNMPVAFPGRWPGKLVANWSADARISARSALPVDVNAGRVTSLTGFSEYLRPNLVPGVPLYLYGSAYPGGRIFNYYAFQKPSATIVASGLNGNAPRNLLQAFPVVQVDAALQRRFPITEGTQFLFRAEAFNMLNHPNFGAIRNTLTSGPATFGYATGTLNNQLGGLSPLYQIGGPRSLQLSLKLQF
jgi:hypothetical protein